VITPPQAPCPPCPTCGRSLTRYTVQSSAGNYCLCYACGHAWHHDREVEAPAKSDVLASHTADASGHLGRAPVSPGASDDV